MKPAPRPCVSCPYRRDVPSGIWDRSEYEKLRRYDGDTQSQPPGLFLCHQTGADDPGRRICSGWVGCHDTANLLALRLALVFGRLTETDYSACLDYRSPVPLFGSGAEAADHGEHDIHQPGPAAVRLITKHETRKATP